MVRRGGSECMRPSRGRRSRRFPCQAQTTAAGAAWRKLEVHSWRVEQTLIKAWAVRGRKLAAGGSERAKRRRPFQGVERPHGAPTARPSWHSSPRGGASRSSLPCSPPSRSSLTLDVPLRYFLPAHLAAAPPSLTAPQRSC